MYLPKSFIYHGIEYRQLKRSKSNCVYVLFHDGYVLHYETFIIPVSHPRSLSGNLRTSEEHYARSSDFGKTAFMYKSFYDAMIKFFELEKARDEKMNVLKKRIIICD